MKYVLDVSVALKWVLHEPQTATARKLRDHATKRIHELHAPDIFSLEVGSALSRLKRGPNPLPATGEASILAADILTTPPEHCPSMDIFHRAMEISSWLRISFYDCLYLVASEELACELVTADQRLVNVAKSHFSVIHLNALP